MVTVVGYMGDGINDAPSMKVADVGISVDTAVDIAKETADVILLDKDLMVLETGIVEGRKVYANMTKYIKMTVSSNFGNIFSLLVASIFLPFLPMAPVHLIVLNLVYDLSCVALPFDNVDQDFLKQPHTWEAKSITRFMVWMGPISSIFDIFDLYLPSTFIIIPLVTGHHYVHGSESCPSVYYLVPNRMVHRIYVVSNHGYPYASYSKSSFCAKQTSLACNLDNFGCSPFCNESALWTASKDSSFSSIRTSLFPILNPHYFLIYDMCHNNQEFLYKKI